MPASKYIRLTSWIILFFWIIGSAKAQPSTFIHIQSENNKAYYVTWNNNTYQSTNTGYLVITQVKPGDHNLVVGFPGNGPEEYHFTCTVTDKPRGFSLKQAIDNSWSLFDMVSFAVTTGISKPKQVKTETVIDEVLEEVNKPVPAIDSAAKAIPAPVVVKKQGAPNEKAAEKTPLVSAIQKIFDKSGPSGIDQVYIVVGKSKTDTIALFIPALQQDAPKPSAANRRVADKNESSDPLARELIAAILPFTRPNLLSK